MFRTLLLAQQEADDFNIDGSLVITVLVIILLVVAIMYFWRRTR